MQRDGAAALCHTAVNTFKRMNNQFHTNAALPTVSIVAPFVGLTKHIYTYIYIYIYIYDPRILESNQNEELQRRLQVRFVVSKVLTWPDR